MDLAPNHHADYPQFSGVFGYLAALTMVCGRGGDGRLITDLAGVVAGDRVLDIGCGPGTAARQAASRGARVIGVDPSAPMLALARLLTRLRSSDGELTWRLGSAESMDVPDGSMSVCWSLASVHHWQDLDAGLDEVERILEPGARFLALEKRTNPGAKGASSHGWTAAQAEAFASVLRGRSFNEVTVSNHDLGRRSVVVVRANR